MQQSSLGITRVTVDKFIRDLISDIGVEASEITDESTFSDLGLDSLDVVELSVATKKQLMVPVVPNDFAEAETIADAINVILGKAGI